MSGGLGSGEGYGFILAEGFQEHTNIPHSENGKSLEETLQWLTVSLNREKEFSLLRN